MKIWCPQKHFLWNQQLCARNVLRFLVIHHSPWKYLKRCCLLYSVHCFLIWVGGTRVITIFQTHLQSAFTSLFTWSHSMILTNIIERKREREKKTTTKHCPKLYMDYLLFICVQNIFKLVTEGPARYFLHSSRGKNPEFIIHLPKVICIKFIIHSTQISSVIFISMSEGPL